ncbi:MAG TPA: flagellar hook capping FlgD N-terminal domain-containing protein [Solirubrobacteraceae bacterium]|nr:flagellar hook capping FlgD N-terminal domain-containing protein [Solirubrobacteraceae bacterium]
MTPAISPAATPATSAGAAAKSTGEAKQSTTTPENPNAELGKNAFLQLMVAQLKAQNPLEPSNGTEYVSELAQFSQLEQTSNIAQSTAASESSQQLAQAVQMIGHTVSYKAPGSGEAVQGEVENVEITSSGATLTIAGQSGIELANVAEVQ